MVAVPCHLKSFHFQAAKTHPPFLKVTSAAKQQSKQRGAGGSQPTARSRATVSLREIAQGLGAVRTEPQALYHPGLHSAGCYLVTGVLRHMRGSLMQGCWLNTWCHWDIHSWQSSCQKPPGVKDPHDSRKKDAECAPPPPPKKGGRVASVRSWFKAGGSSWYPNKHRNQNPAAPKPLLSLGER